MRYLWMVLVLLLPAAAQAEAASKTVRDWSATCDDYSCYARVTGEGGLASGGAGYQLEVARAAGGNEAWVVTLIASKVPQPGREAVDFDVPGQLARKVTLEGLGDDRFTASDQEALEAIFPALRKGSSVTLGYDAGDEAVSVNFSLSGLAAVMLWIDERQGQVGNSNMVKAVEASDDVPLDAGERQSLKEQVLKASHLSLCQWTMEGDAATEFKAQKYDLGEGYGLVIANCSLGAYQPTTVVFLEGSEGLEPLPFADYSSETGWTATLYLGFVDFDAGARILDNDVKFRGIGDCGARSRFQWTGYRFKLLEYAYKDCPGADEPVDENAEIGDFPIIYKAKD